MTVQPKDLNIKKRNKHVYNTKNDCSHLVIMSMETDKKKLLQAEIK